MHTISLRDGAKLQVDVSGNGPSFVLISGLGGTAKFWNPLVEALGPTVHTVRFDQRGIGASERGNEPANIKSLAEDTWEIIDALGIERPVLCGHSTGGAIAQEMELVRPSQTAGVVLSGSWAGPDQFIESMFNIRLDLLTQLPHRYAGLSALLGSPPRWLHGNNTILQQAIAHTPNEVDANVIRERIGALLAHDCRDRLSQLTAAALVLGAEDDMIIPVYLQEELASLLNNSKLHIFDRGGHFFPVTRPADTAAAILPWLASLEML